MVGDKIAIVLTGGPCGGKTSIKTALEKQFDPKEVLMVEEAATRILENYPAPQAPVPREWIVGLQSQIKKLQESDLAEAEKHPTAKVVIFDRGLADGPGYLGSHEEFCQMFSCRMADLWRPYDEVIFLQSLATTDPGKYVALKATNPTRYESVEEAQDVDDRLRLAWERHPGIISYPQGELDEKIAHTIRVIQSYLLKF